MSATLPLDSVDEHRHNAGNVNVYSCEDCGKYIVTIDRDLGIAPYLIDCVATPACKGVMRSALYRIIPWIAALGHLTPAWEWYKPDPAVAERLNKKNQDLLRRGGLLLRPIPQKELPPHDPTAPPR